MSDFEVEFFRRAVDTPKSNVKYADIDVSSSGDNIIVAGVSGKSFFVYSILVMAGGATSVSWKDGPVQKIGPCPLAANGGYFLDSQYPLVVTSDSEDLVLNTTGAVAIGGYVCYAEKDV